LENLHLLLATNVIGELQYNARYKGFYGEFDFYKAFKDRYSKVEDPPQLYEGGFFIPKSMSSESSLEDCVYITISCRQTDQVVLDTYQTITKIADDAYYIRYDGEKPFAEWLTYDPMGIGIQLKKPLFAVAKYDPNAGAFVRSSLKDLKSNFLGVDKRDQELKVIPKNMKSHWMERLSGFSSDTLLQAYVERLFFDGEIGFLEKKRSDIDAIWIQGDKSVFIEVKEKDISKRSPQGFGMDVPRIEDIAKIQDATGRKYVYVVRDINNQKDRALIGWKYISLDDFIDDTKDRPSIEGGHGMRGKGTKNPTKVCGYKRFKDLF